jgi:hypothetical protein
MKSFLRSLETPIIYPSTSNIQAIERTIAIPTSGNTDDDDKSVPATKKAKARITKDQDGIVTSSSKCEFDAEKLAKSKVKAKEEHCQKVATHSSSNTLYLGISIPGYKIPLGW